MNFTRSKDGVARASIRIEFRAGLDLLACAAAWAVDQNYQDGDDIEAALAGLTRADIERTLRDKLSEGGSQVFLFIGERTFMGVDRWDDEAMPAAAVRVLELWPELEPVE
jgi:hypothetical protein